MADTIFDRLARKIELSKQRSLAEKTQRLKPGFSVDAEGNMGFDGGQLTGIANQTWFLTSVRCPPSIGSYLSVHINPVIALPNSIKIRHWDGQNWCSYKDCSSLGGINLWWRQS